jgi:hypothetical protein
MNPDSHWFPGMMVRVSRGQPAPEGKWGKRIAVEPGVPFSAQTLTQGQLHAPAAYDWMKIVLVWDGTGWCRYLDKKPEPIKPGSVLFLMPNAPCAVEPEGGLLATH